MMRARRAIEHKVSMIEKQTETRIAHIGCGKDPLHDWIEIGYDIVPSERRKGFATKAIQIMINNTFLAKDIPRILTRSIEMRVCAARASR